MAKEFLYVYSYDGNKNRILDLMKLWDGVEWVNSDKFDITFDSNNYMILNITSIWNGSDWQNYHRFSYNYSQDGNSFQAFSETWDSNSWLTEEGSFTFLILKVTIPSMQHTGNLTCSMEQKYQQIIHQQ